MRSYLATQDGGYVFEGSIAQFEDCFGGVGGTEDGVRLACQREGWDLTVLDEVPDDYHQNKNAYKAKGIVHGWDAVEAGTLTVPQFSKIPDRGNGPRPVTQEVIAETLRLAELFANPTYRSDQEADRLGPVIDWANARYDELLLSRTSSLDALRQARVEAVARHLGLTV